VDHSILNRGGLQYGPELDQRCRPQLHMTKDAWKVDEPDVNLKGEWKYLYRTVDSSGQTLDFMFSAKRDAKAAQRFFNKGLQAPHTQAPRAINVDKNAAYPPALDEFKQEGALSEDAELRPVKYLNHMLEPDHRRLKPGQTRLRRRLPHGSTPPKRV